MIECCFGHGVDRCLRQQQHSHEGDEQARRRKADGILCVHLHALDLGKRRGRMAGLAV